MFFSSCSDSDGATAFPRLHPLMLRLGGWSFYGFQCRGLSRLVTVLIKGNGTAALEWRALGAQNVMTVSTFFFLLMRRG